MKQIIRYEQKMIRKKQGMRSSILDRDDDIVKKDGKAAKKQKEAGSRLTGLMSPYVVFFNFLEDCAF